MSFCCTFTVLYLVSYEICILYLNLNTIFYFFLLWLHYVLLYCLCIFSFVNCSGRTCICIAWYFHNSFSCVCQCESLYLYGVMLLLVDRLFPGGVRERLIVSHHRHAGLAHRPTGDTNVDDVCRLLRSTGLRTNAKRPMGYPEEYFRWYISMLLAIISSF